MMNSDKNTAEVRRWVAPSLTWDAVTNARARVDGSHESVPTHVGDIEIQPLNRQLFFWWMMTRGKRHMPAADDVKPKELVELLPYIRLLSWNDEDDLIYRIYGSALAAVAGVEPTGRSIFEPKSYHPEWEEDKARFRLMHAKPCGLLIHRDYLSPDGSLTRCEFINFPLAPGKDGMDRIIGSAMICNAVDESNLRFDINVPPVLSCVRFIDIGFGLPEEAAALSL